MKNIKLVILIFSLYFLCVAGVVWFLLTRDVGAIFKTQYQPIADKYLKETVMSRTLVKSPLGTLAPQDITYTFTREGHIYAYSVLRWNDTPADKGKHKIAHQWYSGDKLICRHENVIDFYKSPRIIYGTIAAIILDSGKNHVEVYADGKLISRRDFEIK